MYENRPNIVEVSSIALATGCWMKNYIDESKPEDSIDRKWSLTIYDGEPSSHMLVVPEHWHKYHDEHMTILEGAAEFAIGGKKVILQEGDRKIIPAGQTHGFRSIPGKRFVLKEATNPTGDFKEHFFLDIFLHGSPVGFWHAQRASWDGDCYFPIPIPSWLGGRSLDQLSVFILGGIAKLLLSPRSSLSGLRAHYERERHRET